MKNIVIILVLCFCLFRIDLVKSQSLFSGQYAQTGVLFNPSQHQNARQSYILFQQKSQQLGLGNSYDFSHIQGGTALELGYGEKHFLGFSGGLFSESFGTNREVRLTSGFVGMSYTFQKNLHSFSVGSTAQLHQRRFMTENFRTGSQWVSNVGFDPGLSNNESVGMEPQRYAALNAGIGYSWKDQKQDDIISVQAGGYFLNRPREDFSGTPYRIPIRGFAAAQFRAMQWQKTSLFAEFLGYSQAEMNFTGAGAILRYALENENPFEVWSSGYLDFGLRLLSNRTLTTQLIFDQRFYRLGFSYDHGFGNAENIRFNSFEITLQLKKPIKKKRPKDLQVVDNYSLGQVREFYERPARVATEGGNNTGSGSTPQESATPNEVPKLLFQMKMNFKFAFNQVELDEEAKAYLEDLAKIMQANSRLELEIVGHTDNVGSGTGNKKVSFQRAKNAGDYLVALGIDPARIRVDGKADKEPLVPNDTEVNKATNRRIEFFLFER